MTIEEKYNICYIDGKRYYVTSMADSVLSEDTIPYLFEYNDISIYESSWVNMAVKVLEELDKRDPKSREFLLGLGFSWTNQKVFSDKPRTNHKPFRDIYLNTNFAATNLRKVLQRILEIYDIDMSKCKLITRYHPAVEPIEVREYFRMKNIDSFRNFLKLKGLSDENVEKVINNIEMLNKKYLSTLSKGYDDFFLFDDLQYFCNYRDKVIKHYKNIYPSGNNETVEKVLNYLTAFYKMEKNNKK